MRSWSSKCFLAAGIALSLAGPPAAAQGRTEQVASISIPAQPLASAIVQLGEQTEIMVYAPADLIANKRSSPVEGALSPRAALDSLLNGTGLEAIPSKSGTLIIRVKPSAAPPPASRAAARPRPAKREAEPVGIEEPLVEEALVIVGSYSGSLSRSLDLKLHADRISDAIVAADIGKLPAVNVAEALQRVPGVTISREAGEGQFVGVRGLGPNFQSVTFNGVPISVNENIRNSDQSGRQFRFRVLPADLIGGVVVTKSPTADLVDGGIGANIDIISVKPLDRGNFASGRAFGSFDERAGYLAPNGSFSVGWRNDAHTIGMIASASYQRRDVQFDRFQTFGYGTYTVDGVEGVQVSNGWNTTVEEEQRRRLSYLASIQWRPFDTLELHSDILYSNFNNQIAENRVTYEVGGLAESNLVPGSARIEDGVLYAGAIEDGRIYRSAEYSEQTHANGSVILGADWETGNWTLSPTVSISNADSNLDTPLQRIDSETADRDGLFYQFDLGESPVEEGKIRLLTTNLDLTDPGALTFRRYRIRPINSEDQDITFLLNTVRTLDRDYAGMTLRDMRLGGQRTSRFRDYQRRDRMAELKSGYVIDGSYFGYHVPDDTMNDLIGHHIHWLGPSFEHFRGAFRIGSEYPGVAPEIGDLAPTSDDSRQSYKIDEDILALYGRMDFETRFGGFPVSGNAGARWVETKTTVYGTSVEAHEEDDGSIATIASPRVTEGTYSDLLPSINLQIDLRRRTLLRLAASKSITRPSLASLRDATVPNSKTVSDIYERGKEALSDPGLDVSAVGGNPSLEPYTSVNFDISLEHYLDEFGIASASVFYKRIDNFISGERRWEEMPFAVNDGSSVRMQIAVTRPRNNGEAFLSGLELGYVNRFPGGFGLSASASVTSSSVKFGSVDGQRMTGRLQGVSDFSYSITPFIARGPVEAYLSYTWRSDFESNGNVTIASDTRTDANEAIVAASFGTLDFGITYQFDRTFELFAEGVNLTDTHQSAYQGYEARPYQLQQYGRTLNIGLRATF